MSVQSHYDQWASQYDDQRNPTRDVEGHALRETLAQVPFSEVLELGAGTGKNTMWFAMRANKVFAVDLSAAMLAKAKTKLADMPPAKAVVEFRQEDITRGLNYASGSVDLVSYSLVLEHVDGLQHIFKESARVLRPGGYLYVGELHPFKQYLGSKARFDTGTGEQVLDCHTHNLSDFTQAAALAGLQIAKVNEYWGWDEDQQPPRILALLFQLPPA